MDAPRGLVMPNVIAPQDDPEFKHFMGAAGQGTITWPATGRAIVWPLKIETPTLVKRGVYQVVTAGTLATVEMGVYDYNLAKVVASSAIAVAGSTVPQYVDFTDTTLQPGRYYIALMIAWTTTAPQITRFNPSIGALRLAGAFMMDSASPLPSTLTPAALTTGNDIGLVGGLEVLRGG